MEAALCSSASPPLESNDAGFIREEDTEAKEISTVQSSVNHLNSNSCESSSSIANSRKIVRRKKKNTRDVFAPAASSWSSLHSQQRGLRLTAKRRGPRVSICSNRRGKSDFDALALPLGMSIAAVVAQVLEGERVAKEKIPLDHLSMICASAMRESLANDFGNRFDCFVRSFEESLGSTLRTLRVINEASVYEERGLIRESSAESCSSEMVPPKSLYKQGPGSHSEPLGSIIEACGPSNAVEEIQENLGLDSINQELALLEPMHQLAASSLSRLDSGYNNTMLSPFEKSLWEQTRSNDLETLHVFQNMKRLQLKESKVALQSDSNSLERRKLSLRISKASFNAEEFKTQLEDARHTELLKRCIDSLVAGLLIMSALLLYGTYVHSYKRIIEATGSCSSSPKGATSWWIPKQVTFFTSLLDMLNMARCQVAVFSRMLFGVLMIMTIAYLLFQRSSTSNQVMPVTFILLLLGVGCGIVGKLCIDTLGGNGYHWLLYWEALCLIHFFANMCTKVLFYILHGPVPVAQGTVARALLPYWLRQLVFYVIIILFLPLFGGLMPFASFTDWKNHFLVLIKDNLVASAMENGN
ncbi:protein CPR-5-like isoform X1 [Macadamia integrifolia]|uniref:protein CPR-5-like isoform X1 n=1 Tax=Macadamia integrifolia TaxID=60698 RepID=UPI001C4F5719|nr:protein CPR-5-like isoform X1 [Macadamia integrifolia]